MDIIKLHDRALEATTALVAGVKAEQFSLPTPCAELDVRALLNHLIGGNFRFVKIAHGEPGEAVPSTGDFVHDDALGPYRESAIAVSEAWGEPMVLERTVHLPFGDFPGAYALAFTSSRRSSTAGTWPRPPGSRPRSSPSCMPSHGRARRT
jgi:uncharacterized protein (TIGR03086 family)